MTAKGLRLLTVVGLLAGDGLALLAWSQDWFTLRVDGRAVPVPGSIAGGAVLAFALTGLALVLAVLIAGPVARTVLGVLQLAVAACLVAAVGMTLADPIAASRPVVTTVTGLTGESAVRAVRGADPSGWPVAAVLAGVVLAFFGVLLAVGARRWPVGGRRFERSRAVAADPESADTIAEWDALSRGSDPTEPAPRSTDARPGTAAAPTDAPDPTDAADHDPADPDGSPGPERRPG